MKRRDFLKNVGLTGMAGMLAPSMLTSCTAKGAIGKNDIKDSYQTQLLVVGGGTSGVCAAVGAARMGIKTMLVDSGNCLGGMATKGLIGPFMTCYDASGENMIIRGLFEEVVNRLVDRGAAIHPKDVRQGTEFTAWISVGHDHCTPFDPEILKIVFEEMCAEAGVKLLYQANFVKPVMNGRRITGAVLFTPSGLERVQADWVIDATGDGNVACAAGVPYVFGDEKRYNRHRCSSVLIMSIRTDSLPRSCLIFPNSGVSMVSVTAACTGVLPRRRQRENGTWQENLSICFALSKRTNGSSTVPVYTMWILHRLKISLRHKQKAAVRCRN